LHREKGKNPNEEPEKKTRDALGDEIPLAVPGHGLPLQRMPVLLVGFTERGHLLCGQRRHVP